MHMRQFGKVDILQAAFSEALKMGDRGERDAAILQPNQNFQPMNL
jgi:hypothetical protein